MFCRNFSLTAGSHRKFHYSPNCIVGWKHSRRPLTRFFLHYIDYIGNKYVFFLFLFFHSVYRYCPFSVYTFIFSHLNDGVRFLLPRPRTCASETVLLAVPVRLVFLQIPPEEISKYRRKQIYPLLLFFIFSTRFFNEIQYFTFLDFKFEITRISSGLVDLFLFNFFSLTCFFLFLVLLRLLLTLLRGYDFVRNFEQFLKCLPHLKLKNIEEHGSFLTSSCTVRDVRILFFS